MKKITLIVASLFLSLGAWAQWDGQKLESVSAAPATTLESGYYVIYNNGRGTFMNSEGALGQAKVTWPKTASATGIAALNSEEALNGDGAKNKKAYVFYLDVKEGNKVSLKTGYGDYVPALTGNTEFNYSAEEGVWNYNFKVEGENSYLFLWSESNVGLDCNGWGADTHTYSTVAGWNKDGSYGVSGNQSWTLHKATMGVSNHINVTYKYMLDGKVYASETVEQAKNSEASAPAKPFLAIDGYTGTIGEENCEVVVNCSANLPFVAAADVESIDTWYYVKMHANSLETRYIEENKDASVDWTKKSLAVHTDSLLWGFAGDIWNGFKLVNKGSKNAVTSTSGAAKVGAAANATAFVLSASDASASGFCLKYPAATEYLNGQSGKVASWDDNDAGSTFFLQVYSEDLFDLSESIEGWKDVTNAPYVAPIANPDLSSLEAWGETVWNAASYTTYDAENGVMEFVAGENTSASLVQEGANFMGTYRLTGKAYHKGAGNAVMFVGDKTVAIPEAEELTEIALEFESYEPLTIGYRCEFDAADDVLVVGGFKVETKTSMSLQNKFSEVAEKLGDAQWKLENTFTALYEANKTTFDAAYASELEIFSALQNGQKVFKSAVKSSIQAAEAELAADYMKVLSYYSGKFNTVYSEADQMLWTLEGTEAYDVLTAAIPTDEAIAAVTEVTQLEEMVAAMEAAMETAREYIPEDVVLEHDAVIEIKVGETFQLVAKVLPATASQAVNYFSADWKEQYITVTETGLVTALAEGEVTITIESVADAWVYTECTVKVVGLTDDIENIEAETETVIYDLSGRRVEKMEKGIYIVNGKKVIK